MASVKKFNYFENYILKIKFLQIPPSHTLDLNVPKRYQTWNLQSLFPSLPTIFLTARVMRVKRMTQKL